VKDPCRGVPAAGRVMNSSLNRIDLAVSMLACIALAGCGSPDSSDDAVRSEPAEPQRIVSMVPNLTEILFALDLADRIVGVSSFCDYPPEVETTARVGGVLNPDIEAILALEPDLVVNIPGNASEKTIGRLNELGIRTLVVSTETVADMFRSIEVLGAATGRRSAAMALTTSLNEQLQIIRDRVATTVPRKTLFVIGHSPLYVAGSGTFINDLVEIAGGTNIAGDALGQYPRFGIEEVIVRAPEVIIDSTLGTAFPARDVATRREWWSRWDTLPAVRDGRIYGLDTDTLLRPGPRMPAAARMVAEVIHPELFSEAPKG
jgi:iron complex transport system substrate-binding protein